MSAVKTSLLLFATWIPSSLSHMSMQYPYPRDTLSGASYAVWQQNEPMWSVHPTICHSLDEDDTVRSGNSFAAGDFVEIDIYGSAPHDGGHCSFWWTTDTSSTWNKIIDVKDCTLEDSFYVMMPYTMDTACATKCTFAWTWVPVSSGACEIYMNCAEVSVSGVTGASSSEIELDFQAMLDTGDPCERVDDTTHWTTIMGDIKTSYTSEDANGGATTVDTADTDIVVTVDGTDIEESIEEGTDAMCVNADAPNIDGDIQNDGVCGDTCDNCRCDDGQCCSAAGYCGPEFAGYNNITGLAEYYYYDNGERSLYSDEDTAFADYCTDNQGDWRLVSCDSTASGSSSGSSDSSAQSIGTKVVSIMVFVLVSVFVSL